MTHPALTTPTPPNVDRLLKICAAYSRCGRGFEHASGSNALDFKVRDGFSADARRKVMSNTVVWYDEQEGSTWKRDNDAGTGAQQETP